MSQIHSSLTAMFSRATMRRSACTRSSSRRLQPTGQRCADARRLLELPRPIAEAGDPVGQRADRADVDDAARGLGVHRLAGEGVDHRLAAALEQAELRLVLPLLQVADAAPAQDAAFLVEHDQVADGIMLLLVALGSTNWLTPGPYSIV